MGSPVREIFSERDRHEIHYDCESFALVYEGFLKIYTRSVGGDGIIDSYGRFVEVNDKMKRAGGEYFNENRMKIVEVYFQLLESGILIRDASFHNYCVDNEVWKEV